MTLINEVAIICNRLAPTGWHDLLLHHGLDIQALDLEQELLKPLQIDRTQPGFEDFCLAGTRGIEPGKPALSLLYHALACPNVITDAQAKPLQAYPTAGELETVLNLAYGIRPPTLDQLKQRTQGAPLALVVFALEYRPAPDTVHRAHADLCFSRTGISRVGTASPLYDDRLRGFLPFVDGDDYAIRVLPSRYSAYLAVQRKGDSASFGPMRFGRLDASLDFWVPLHKLFEGDECIAGLTLAVALEAQHKNEKLRRIHLQLGPSSGWGEPDISRAPFVIIDDLAHWLEKEHYGPGLLAATPRKRLVEAAQYQGKPLTFKVPEKPGLLDSSLYLSESAPEYVHIRHKVDNTGNVINLNQHATMMDELRAGKFDALHYLDFTADGYVNAHCPALEASIPLRIAAYSLLCAPDFYPLCNQRRLSEWLESMPSVTDLFPTPPTCLSDTRTPANVQSFKAIFSRADMGVTAIVAQPDQRTGDVAALKPNVAPARRAACLPDAAAGIFAPGWDIGRDHDKSVSPELEHLAAYMLGSPFPEDAKLCAALSSFWPAVAPDSAQAFEPHNNRHTIKPMLDSEIGKDSGIAWDGITPPKHYLNNDQPHIAFTSSLYGDYTQNALDGKFSLALTGKIDFFEYQQRVDALRRIRLSLGERYKEWHVTSFRMATLDDLQALASNLQVPAAQQTYRFQLVRTKPAASDEFNTVHVAVIDTLTFLVWPDVMLRREASRPWARV